MGLLHAESTSNHASRDVFDRVSEMANAFRSIPSASLVASQGEEFGVSCVLAAQAAEPEVALASDAESGLAIATDLRLDNRAAIAADLGIEDRADDLSDAALLLEAYRAWSLEVASAILGDGTFLLWDSRRRRLVCWRDVAGARPLYYKHLGQLDLVVSTDLRSLVAHPAIDTRLDLPYTSALLRYGPVFSHPSRTLCDGVMKLRAGSMLILDEHGLQSKRYWSPTEIPERRYVDNDEYVEELRILLERAVACRLTDGSPVVASHLSGGLDSSSVAVIAHRALARQGRSLIGMSWAPPHDLLPPVEDDERPLVDAIADSEGLDLRYTQALSADLIDQYTRDVALRPTTTLQLELGASRNAAGAGVRTVLSGWGGDELVVNNGKGYFADLARKGRWLTLQRELKLRTDIHEGSVLSMVRGRVVLPLLSDRLLHRVRPDMRPARYGLPACLRKDFAAELAKVEPLDWQATRERPGVRQYQIAKFEHGHLQYRMESWAAHGTDIGVVYAYPLLDRRLIEFALSVPDHLYFKDGWKRWLYRTAMEGVLPDDVRWHPHKQDPAMAEQVGKLYTESAEARKRVLGSRRENPYVDIDAYWKAAENSHPNGHTGPAPGNNAIWMPFTSLSAG
jgi:asparagine synthase (glutamine-hydrolysing)